MTTALSADCKIPLDGPDPAHDVLKSLDELRDELDVRQFCENCGFKGDVPRVIEIWHRLEAALRSAEPTIRSPQPGQGLASVWLRSICRRASKVEAAVARRANRWHDVLFHDDENLLQLVTHDWEVGYYIRQRQNPRPLSILSLLQPNDPPFARLRQVIEAWAFTLETDSKQKRELGVSERHLDYERESGELLLQAVDVIAIDAGVIGNEDFGEMVLKCVRSPAALVRSLVPMMSADRLRSWVQSLGPEAQDLRDASRYSTRAISLEMSGFMSMSRSTTIN